MVLGTDFPAFYVLQEVGKLTLRKFLDSGVCKNYGVPINVIFWFELNELYIFDFANATAGDGI